MRRILQIASLALPLLCTPSSARILVVKTHTNASDACTLSPTSVLECTPLGALLETPLLSGERDTVVFPRRGDTAVTVTWFQSFADVYKPVVMIDSSFMATGNVRYRFEGLSLRFQASPVHVEGFSFTRAGTNRSSIGLLGPGPDNITRNYFNLAPGDSGTGSNYSIYGILVGPKNLKTRITDNWFGIFGTAFSAGRAVTIYGDSILVRNNHFGTTRAGQPVLFNASAIDVSMYTATGSPDTVYAPVGGTVSGNRIAACSEMSGGIALGGSTGEGGTRGWVITGNGIGVASDSTKVLPGCAPSLNEAYSGIVLTSSTSAHVLTGNLVQDNRVWVSPSGIVVRGGATTGNIVRRNRVGSPDETVTTPIISYNGIFVHGGAIANTIDSNTIGGSATGIRFGWGTGYGNGLDNIVRSNLIGAVATAGSPANDTGISLGYTSAGNLFEGNVIAGNRHQGLVMAGSFLQPNRIERNRFGITGSGALRPNGGSSIRSVSGSGRQVVRGNLIGPSTGWGVEVALSTSRATVLDSNRFLAGQDSGAILFQGSDSLRILDNAFDSCSIACVQLRGSKIGLIARNRFGGQSPALIARAHPTQSWLVTAALLDSNVLPSIAVPVDLIGTAGYTPNDAGDADAGPMDLINHPLLKTAAAQGDSVVLTYDLDLALTTGAPRIHVYAKLPDSTVLLPLGSWAAQTGSGVRLAFKPKISLPNGSRIRAGLTDAAGNSSEIDSGRVLSGGVGIAFRSNRGLQTGAPQWADGRLTLRLEGPSQIRWATKGLDGRVRNQGSADLAAGVHTLAIPAGVEPSVLRVTINGKARLVRLINLGTP